MPTTLGRSYVRHMATPAESVEAALVRAAAAGDSGAWQRLVDEHAELVWGIARRHDLSRPEAAEVSATTWLRLVENLDRLDAPAGVRSWLAGTARRESLRHLARTGRLSGPTGGGQAPQRAPPPATRPLSPRCRELWRLLVRESHPTYEQLAAAMRVPDDEHRRQRRLPLLRLVRRDVGR